MEKKDFEAINVLCVFKSFDRKGLRNQITPYRFETQAGETHYVKEIRSSQREDVKTGYHYHFVVKTRRDRSFHIVFDSESLTWRLINEVPEEYFHFD